MAVLTSPWNRLETSRDLEVSWEQYSQILSSADSGSWLFHPQTTLKPQAGPKKRHSARAHPIQVPLAEDKDQGRVSHWTYCSRVEAARLADRGKGSLLFLFCRLPQSFLFSPPSPKERFIAASCSLFTTAGQMFEGRHSLFSHKSPYH